MNLRVLRLARAYYKYLIAAMLAIAGITASQLYAPWALRELTGLAVEGDPDIAEKALRIGVVLFLTYVAQAFCQFVRSYFTHYAAWNFVADLRKMVYDKLQSLSMKYFHDKQTGQLMSRVINDTMEVELLVAHAAPDLCVNVLVFAGVAMMMFMINFRLALVSLISIPLLAVLSRIYSKKVLPRFRARQKIVGELNATLQDNLTGIKEIQVFNQHGYESMKVGRLARAHAKSTLDALRWSAVYHPSVQFLSAMGTVFIVSYGGYLVSKGLLPIEDIVAFVMYLGIFYQPISALAQINEQVQTATAAIERIFEVLDMETNVPEKPGAVELSRVKGAVEFENVCFQYADSNGAEAHGAESSMVLKNINLKINPGEIVALVGPTGVGKTTMVSLIDRFYDPTMGRIMIDGIDLRDVTLKSLRDNTSIVLQDVFLFNGTVLENIAYGFKDATREQIIEASKTARAHDFIEAFENGYDTQIGEKGVRLSGGQKQRISIARAVLRNSPILILDEATASVDVETEKLIHEAMDQVMKGRTTILIAHRLSTVKKADKIVVLNNGEIEEMGTHEQLVHNGGLYEYLSGINARG